MKDKKYELVKEDKKTFTDGGAIYRIRALKDFGDVKTGDLGGYIEKEDNLSQEGNCWVYDNARAFDNAKVYENAKIYGEAQVCDNVKIFGNAEIFENGLVRGVTEVSDNAQIYGNALVRNDVKIFENAKIYGNSKISDNAQIYGNAEVYDNTKVFGEAKVYNNAKIYGTSEISDSAVVCEKAEIGGHTELYHYDYIDGSIKMIDNVTKESPEKNEIKILENEIQKYEEHCSKVVDKLKLQDELPNFQVISQKGLLYEKNSEENNVSEMKNFIENLKGEEYWDNMNLKDIRDWKELKNDEFVSIVYETKDDKGNVELEEFNDYNDYAKDTVINALSKEFAKNPDTIESLKKDILDKVPNKEVVKEKIEVDEVEKTEKTSSKTFGYRSDF